MIVTIDGPAGAGKSTIARELAVRLHATFLDTGATYRAVTLAILRCGIASFDDAASMIACARAAKIRLVPVEGIGTRVYLGDEDVSDAIRSAQVTQNVRYPSATPEVRSVLVELQRQIARSCCRDVVTEGRDQGSVVFPDAEFKFYLDAGSRVRAARRLKEIAVQKAGNPDAIPTLEELERQIVDRDESDRKRLVGPLTVPENAIVVDSSDMTIEEVAQKLYDHVRSPK